MRWLRRAAPQVLFIMETELWPIWLDAVARQSTVAWINGRISDRAFPRYRMIGPMMRGLFSRLRILCVISNQDAMRARKLGASASLIHVLGNVKVDLATISVKPARPRPGQWLVAGSTRPGEEKTVLVAFRSILRKHPQAQLCLAPRHLERIPSVQGMVEEMGLTYELRSKGDGQRVNVLILDTHGDLGSFYGRAVAAFVGGTLVPVGGHNVLEPASAGVPVFFGPYTANVREQADGLMRCGGGFRITSAEALAVHWERCLHSPLRALAAGRRAWDYVAGQRGVARRLVRLLAKEGLL
jgi:3-deoxy-D-manno-octulosonic-acid transferase